MLFPKYLIKMVEVKLIYTNAILRNMKLVSAMTKRINLVFAHLGIWVIYWIFQICLFSLAFEGVLSNKNLLSDIVVNLSLGTLYFYVLLLFVFPRNAAPIGIFKFIWRLIFVLLLFIAFRRTLILLMAEYSDFGGVVVTNLKFFMVSSFDLFTRFGIYAGIFWFFRRQVALQQQVFERQLAEQKLKNDLLASKHAALKAQINPHFLFNTLSFIHSKAISSNNPILDKAILLLSDILRHALRDTADDSLVDLQNEMQHIQRLIELQQLRFNGRFYVNMHVEDVDTSLRIPPLILMTFFENALKHGVYDEVNDPICLQVRQADGLLQIYLRNKIREADTVASQDQFSIGKRYVHQALEQAYSDRFDLDYTDDGAYHTVHLKINTYDPLLNH